MGIGVDIVEIERFSDTEALSGARFGSNVFTANERKYCAAKASPARHLAGTFAAKEAAFKAVGGKHVSDFEIRRLPSGKPEVWRNNKRLSSIIISISHSKTHAVAVALSQK